MDGDTEPSVKMKRYSNIGDTPKIQPVSKTEPEPKLVEKLRPAPKPEPATPTVSTPKPVEKTPSFDASEYSEEKISITKPTESTTSDDKKLGLVLLAIMSQIRDIWASKRDDNSIDIEQIDGPVCKFMVENGKIIFKAGSFNNVDSQIKNSILSKLKEYGIE